MRQLRINYDVVDHVGSVSALDVIEEFGENSALHLQPYLLASLDAGSESIVKGDDVLT